jgi:hypothetical protein
MKHCILMALCLGPLLGCSKGPAGPADIDKAGPALRTALEAWKDGKTPQELAGQSPSIVMNEDDWREGKRLLDYRMEEAGALQGRQVVWWAQIKLEGKGGRPESRRAKYLIDTTPRLVIVRDRFAS